MARIYVDVDGTLVDGSLDRTFKEKEISIGIEKAVEWYESVNLSYLKLNHMLISTLTELKAEGHELILWTNRNENKIEMTRKNLGSHWYLFKDHMFRNGNKLDDRLDGIILDNELKYSACGRLVLIEFPTGGES